MQRRTEPKLWEDHAMSWSRRSADSKRGIHALPIQSIVVVLFALTMLVLATAVAPLYADGFKHARIVKAKSDVNAITQAIYLYSVHTGNFPPKLVDLTLATRNADGKLDGPFLRGLPVPPSGGTPPWPITYGYVLKGSGTFTVFAAGDHAVVSSP